MSRYIFVHTSINIDILYLFAQDTIVIVPPHPYCIEEDRHDVAALSPGKTVDLHVSCSSSSAVCVLSMDSEECRRRVHTKTVQVYKSIYLHISVCTFLTVSYQMTCCANLSSSTPWRSWICPSRDLWRTRVWWLWSSCRTTPTTASVRDSRREHGVQSPPYAVISGGKRNSNNPLPVQQAQGFRIPDGLRWRRSGGGQAWQQCLWG